MGATHIHALGGHVLAIYYSTIIVVAFLQQCGTVPIMMNDSTQVGPTAVPVQQ